MVVHTSPLGSSGIGFTRSETQFFHQAGTKQAIVDLAQAESLVIYCGAGVTIDRTGLSWKSLMAELLEAELRKRRDQPQRGSGHSDTVAEEVGILRDHLSPQELASILSEVSIDHAGSRDKALASLVSRLHILLYDNYGWQSGALVRNVVRLAFGYLQLRRRVIVVTTNYDDYLETEYSEYSKEVKAGRVRGRGTPKSQLDLPGLHVTVLGRSTPAANRRSSSPDLGQLEIAYLHGRVTQMHKGKAGDVVVSERDYHTSHGRVTENLIKLFRTDNAGLLIVGSSLTDPPLLASLAETHKLTRRYALIPLQATGMTDLEPKVFERVQSYLLQRGEHFGVKFLFPDFHYQIAQFCQEVLTCVGNGVPDSYTDDSQDVRYGKRLVAWWNRWKQVDEQRGLDQTHTVVRECLGSVVDALARYKGAERTASEPELLKIELWVRNQPQDYRQLALWASSVGILRDRRILRTAELDLSSRNASVRAFLEGQPQYVSQDSIQGDATDASRWRSFLSVPVRIENLDDGSLLGLPVGVVTLATMAEKDESRIPHQSTADMEDLVKMLLALGEDLLQA